VGSYGYVVLESVAWITIGPSRDRIAARLAEILPWSHTISGLAQR